MPLSDKNNQHQNLAEPVPGEIQASIGHRLAILVRLKRRFVDEHMKKIGLSRTEWQILVWLRILGPCSQKQLLQHSDIDAAHLARVLDKFEKQQWITRRPIPSDRRSLFIELTDFTQKNLIPVVEDIRRQEQEIFTTGLSLSEQKQLASLLQRLECNMQQALNNQE